MAGRLYLDTARLGLMSPSAQRMNNDVARFAGEEAASLYFDDFLRHGTDAWPDSLRRRYPALRAWRGIPHLKVSLKRLAGASTDSSVLVANRSAQLMKLAAELLARLCRNVLVTDLCWPSYLRILRRRVQIAAGRLTRVQVRRKVFRDHIRSTELAAMLAESFVQHGCDGLFLPAIDNLGIRLPIREIVQAIEARAKIRFVVVDGAQAFCQAPVQIHQAYCDFFIAGAHKWLRAYHPLGIAFYGMRPSAPYVEIAYRSMLARGVLDDPLLRYTSQLQNGRDPRYGETVAVTPLFSCQGAAVDALGNTDPAKRSSHDFDALFELARNGNWCPLSIDPSLRSRIALLTARRNSSLATSPAQIRRTFHDAGVALTAYRGGMIRISMPEQPWSQQQRDVLHKSLTQCHRHCAAPYILHGANHAR